MLSTIIGIFAGGLLTIATAIIVELYRKPKLQITICEPHVKSFTSEYLAQKAKFLLLEIINVKLPFCFRWMSRNPAVQCHGKIDFYDLDGQKVFETAMPIKWSGKSPNIGVSLKINENIISVIDPTPDYIAENIYPGESMKMDVVAKFDSDENCYGWTWANETEKGWRNKEFELLRKNYIAKISLFTSGEKYEKYFRVLNETNFDNFRLTEVLNKDVLK